MKFPTLHIVSVYVLIGGISACGFATYAQPSKESADMVCFGNEEIVISKGESVTINGNLKTVGNISIVNNGSLIFGGEGNRYFSNEVNNKLFTGIGDFVVEGTGTLNLDSDKPLNIYNLKMNTLSGGSFLCNNSLVIENELTLNSGNIEVFKGYALKIESRNPAAVNALFENNSKSYVIGNMQRKVSTGETYMFPVGNLNGYYPVKIENQFNDADFLNVNFTSDYNLGNRIDIKNDVVTFNQIINIGGWEITADKNNLSGKINFTGQIEGFKRSAELKSNLFALIMAGDYKNGFPKWQKAGVLPLLGSDTRKSFSPVVSATDINKLGLFAMATGVETEFVNFIAPGEGRESRFIINELATFGEPELIMYNSSGKELFRAKPYHNNLDMKNYKDGTYYYVFNYTLDGIRYSKQDFIDVKASF